MYCFCNTGILTSREWLYTNSRLFLVSDKPAPHPICTVQTPGFCLCVVLWLQNWSWHAVSPSTFLSCWQYRESHLSPFCLSTSPYCWLTLLLCFIFHCGSELFRIRSYEWSPVWNLSIASPRERLQSIRPRCGYNRFTLRPLCPIHSVLVALHGFLWQWGFAHTNSWAEPLLLGVILWPVLAAAPGILLEV